LHSKIEKRTALATINFATAYPSASIQLPSCALTGCNNYVSASSTCYSQSNIEFYYLQECFCSVLDLPTVCAPACNATSDLSSVASWYWALCRPAMASRTSSLAIYNGSTVPEWAIQTNLGNSIQETRAGSFKHLPAVIASPIAAFGLLILCYWFMTRDRRIKPAPPPPPPPPPDPLLHPFEYPGKRNLTLQNVVDISKEIEKMANSAVRAKDARTERRFMQLESFLTCGLCHRLYHNPVSLFQPAASTCLHVVCGACAVPHFERTFRCPFDHNLINKIEDNEHLRQVMDAYLQQFPGLQPLKYEIEEWEQIYLPGKIIHISKTDNLSPQPKPVNTNINSKVEPPVLGQESYYLNSLVTTKA